MAGVQLPHGETARPPPPVGSSSIIPQGVGAPPPPGMDPKRGKLMCIKVRMLDDSVGVFHLGHKALGQALFDEVCRHLNLLECDYFGLEFLDCYGSHCWLDKEKPILRQITSSQSDARFYFVVKFYTPNPSDLEEEYTRYLFAMQLKRDLSTGEFVCNDNTAALMVGYIVQSECGDYSAEDYPDHTYLSSTRFVPNQNADFQRKVMENHKKLIGMSPGESDLALLETARRCDFYGVKFHIAKDVEGTAVNLSVAHMGVRVFHQLQCVSTFSWAKIRKLSFKRKKLLIKLHPESYQYYKETIEFVFETRNECKSFWKKCVEHHAFFRCVDIETPTKAKDGKFFSRGSSFRYNGRTQKQLIDYVREHHKRREPFTRPIRPSFSTRSERLSRPAHFGGTMPYSSLSERSLPTPLVPAGRNGGVTASRPPQSQPTQQRNGRAQAPNQRHHHPAETTSSMSPPAPSQRGATNGSGNVPDSGPISGPAAYGSGSKSEFSIHQKQISPSKKYGISASASSSLDKRQQQRPIQPAESSDSGALTVYGTLSETPPTSTRRVHVLSDTPPTTSSRRPAAALAAGQDVSPYGPLSPRLVHNDSIGEGVSSQSERGDYGYFKGTLDTSSRKKKLPTIKSFHIARELLMTERTFVTDLKIVCEHLKTAFEPIKVILHGARVLTDLFTSIQPILDFHKGHLTELEAKISAWERSADVDSEGSSDFRIGDSLLCAVHNTIHHYKQYMQQLPVYMASLDELYRTKKSFQNAYRHFEERKVCYLPVNALLLKPAHRLLVWQQILARLVGFYLEEAGENNADLSDCRVAMDRISAVNKDNRHTLESIENYVKLIELERDLADVENLVQPNRIFLREGCLQRWSKHGAVSRMFLIFNDCLVYAHRTHNSSSSSKDVSFRLHGQIPLRGLMLEDGDAYGVTKDLPHCFTVYGANRSIIVAASTHMEKQRWIEDILCAVKIAKESKLDLLPESATIKSTHSNDDVRTESNASTFSPSEDPSSGTRSLIASSSASASDDRQTSHRANSTLHVCWHRQTTLTKEDLHKASKNQMSGYLVRKFRNSSGWQRLWVVQTQFCLFFYKSHADDEPLANLPLLGYEVGPPSLDDDINKDNVFKLHYKTHFYFFRADSQYAYSRWLESIRTACLCKTPMNPVVPLQLSSN